MVKSVLIFIGVVLFMFATASSQQTGSVSGVVYDHDGDPVSGAYVHLTEGGWHCGGGHGHHHYGDNYFTQSGDDGTFFIGDVTQGDYQAVASLMGYGHDSEEIEVVPDQNTEVEFTLEMGGYDDGGMNCDSLEIVELSGWAIVEEDSFMTHYYLDTENDGQADYRMLFGPSWYDPGSGAERPADGDSIWIVGGIMGYSEPQPVVIYEINGLFWREPGDGHGGHGGYGGDCPYPDSVDLVEKNGLAMVDEMPHMDMYFLDEDFDGHEDYFLNFGAPWYDPGNGATRPDDGDSVDVVGGLMEGCMDRPMIIVYEINGQFWREPGDTTGLWLEPTGVDNPAERQLPDDFVSVGSYPNPFNATAIISFELSQAERVRVSVYDMLGREVGVLADRVFPAGNNDVVFDLGQFGRNGSSVYFYRLKAENSVFTGKMVLLK